MILFFLETVNPIV